ncbi:uncharacterized protein [Paramormyrops kingsleyae]|uniref:uncharacterized protein n=1 Tax=Paramormyrops kingsleyae TaxID=1676925 RepID=UPI003B97BD3A
MTNILVKQEQSAPKKMKITSLTIILILFNFKINSTDERLVVTGADEPVYAHAGEEVTLSCSVNSTFNVTELYVEWTKTDDDIMVLQYSKGNILERYSGRAEFFTEEIPKGNFSMKLRKVRTEDKGEFRCEAYSDTDPGGSTTARIAALGYSSLHWLILGLCIAVTPAVLLTGALSDWHYRSKSKSRQALLSHWSHAAVPPIMVSSAFILWGVTEGSTEEAVTCAAISLLNILVSFNMNSDRLYPGIHWGVIYLTRTVGSTIIIMAICSVPVIEFSTRYSTTTAGKVTLGVFVGGIVLMTIFIASMQFVFLWIYHKYVTLPRATFQEKLKKKLWAVCVFLIIMVLVTIGVRVFVVEHFSEKAETGTVLIIFIIFTIVFLMPCGNIMFMLTLNFYVLLIASMRDTYLLGHFIPNVVASLGICACCIAKMFLCSIRHFF